MKILLEEGVWLAEGEGDPPRTLVEENAKEFKNITEACRALIEARKRRPFRNAQIVRAVKMILVENCLSQHGEGNCPYVNSYMNGDIPVSGCSYKYGELPTVGIPDWCPLKDYEEPR